MFQFGVLAHMDLLVTEVMKVRTNAWMEELPGPERDIRVVVSTVDAWAVKGMIGRRLDELSLKLALVDMEAYHIEQMVAAAAGCGPRSFETMVFFGDEHQLTQFQAQSTCHPAALGEQRLSD
jgi:hypothetical protein